MIENINCPECGSNRTEVCPPPVQVWIQCLDCNARWFEPLRMPCHEPLPMYCTNEEWVKAAFALFPMLETICLSKNESLIGLGDNRGTCIFSIPRPKGWENKSYFRKDYFPPPEPDWESMVGMFFKFWDGDNEPPDKSAMFGILAGYDSNDGYPFIAASNFFKHARPYKMPEPLEPPAKLEGE